jgi:hypothetical protein
MDDEIVVPAYRFAFIDVVIAAGAAVRDFVDTVVELMCAHANWKRDRVRVAQEMQAEIERIVSEG